MALRGQTDRALAQKLASTQTHQIACQRRLSELQKFQEAYVAEGEYLTNALTLQNRELFLTRLTQAIKSQQTLVNQAERQVANQRTLWSQHHQQTNNLNKLAETASQEERGLASKKEQLAQDEFRDRRHALD